MGWLSKLIPKPKVPQVVKDVHPYLDIPNFRLPKPKVEVNGPEIPDAGDLAEDVIEGLFKGLENSSWGRANASFLLWLRNTAQLGILVLVVLFAVGIISLVTYLIVRFMSRMKSK
jgi:hypothetical protein